MTDLITRARRWYTSDPDRRIAQMWTLAAGISLFNASMEVVNFDTWMAAFFACAAAYFAWDVSNRSCPHE
jgi:hypothetical protein